MNEFIREVANFIIDNHTINEASAHFQKSARSIKLYLAKVRDENDPDYDAILAEKLRLSQLKIQLMGVKKGGQNSKRKTQMSEVEKRHYAEMYLNGFTYSALEEKTGIPRSTLQENIRQIDDISLQSEIDDYVKKAKQGKKGGR